MTRPFNLGRDEAEALVDLIEQTNQAYPLDQLARELRERFGMLTKEQQQKQAAENQ